MKRNLLKNSFDVREPDFGDWASFKAFKELYFDKKKDQEELMTALYFFHLNPVAAMPDGPIKHYFNQENRNTLIKMLPKIYKSKKQADLWEKNVQSKIPNKLIYHHSFPSSSSSSSSLITKRRVHAWIKEERILKKVLQEE